jgi:predicted DCC family thiol-disulfide oxidoreductase YuxK
VKHSWTGGQYSLWRALLGLAIAGTLAFDVDRWSFRLPAILLALALASGIRDRLAAFLLAVLAGALGAWAAAAILLLHAATHGSPYGAFDARGRADPGGNWILPRWNLALRRVLLLAVAAAGILRRSEVPPWPVAAAIALAACDPGWIPPRRESSASRVFYDGACGLCHLFVRLVLAEDFTGRTFRFAPLDSDAARAAFDESERRTLPDSVVVKTPGGLTLVRARGTVHVLSRLGGAWRLAGTLARLLPWRVLDAGYDGIARVRRRIFARPATACPVVPRHLAERFDP